MKKTLLILMSLVSTLLAGAQELTEDESAAIVRSSEYRAAMQARTAVVESIYAAVLRGVEPEQLQKTFDAGVEQGNYEDFYTLLFGSAKDGEQFVSRLAEAQAAFLKANPVLEKFRDEFTCKTCPQNASEQFAYLLKNIKAFHQIVSEPVTTGRNVEAATPCGSYLNQLKLLACGALCTGTGPAIIACGWACWCTFCRKDSVVASHICAD